jgi:superfamily II DNA/RNA helicase
LETIEELSAFLQAARQDGARGRLRARGEARSIIRENGVLPQGAPPFAATIDTDLAEYAFSLLRASLALKERGGAVDEWRAGFLAAANGFEALVQNGSPDDPARGFNRVMGAAAYHLAGYSALAFSLMAQGPAELNVNPAERALIELIGRDLTSLANRARDWLTDLEHTDGVLAARLAEGIFDPDDAITEVVTTSIFRALAHFELALQTGAAALVETARAILARTLSLCANANAVSLWWLTRVTANLIDDLWSSSLHTVLPVGGPPGAQDYTALRRLFLGVLFAKRISEVELWPSQLEAATRSTDLSDDLVVALPTSAGKTRIAEMATLMTLSVGKRVLIVTPLRALSAQTERSFRSTFSALGFTISSLYGAAGLAGTDEDALRTQNIVIATPEKIDFALRNDPNIIDDVGLVVLDEGHLIGPADREIRYENLVQRLLRRADAADRRIVCLSAILPAGDQLDDMNAWIRSDTPGDPIQSKWRPTRQRFGTIEWHGNAAQLRFSLEPDAPFIRQFIPEVPPIPPRRTSFPRDNKELTLAAAWRFSGAGKRALIFCTQRDHVEGYAESVVELNHRGFLPSLLDDADRVARAVTIGTEWLGANHPAVRCLALGVAIHHARLPSPFLREVEALLATGTLQVVIASPTLAQGLNLNAAVLLIPTLYRAGQLLSGEEFANVAGRAGRAFVDLDGLVLHVMRQPQSWRFREWAKLVNSAKARSLSSGIIAVVAEVTRRLARTGVFGRADAFEYLANSQEAWFPADAPDEQETIQSLIERLDATVLGLFESLEAETADLAQMLETALEGSLWARQVARMAGDTRQYQLWIMRARSVLIWNKTTAIQRKAQFAMGVGLESGLAIDAIAPQMLQRLDEADLAAIQGNAVDIGAALAAIAETMLAIPPFVPDDVLPANWRAVLQTWIGGGDVAAIGSDNMKVVEDVFIYRLTWALEALRMKRRLTGPEPDYVEGGASACLEAGLPSSMMAMLVRSGLPSRVAARRVILDTAPAFVTQGEMIAWLGSNEVTALTDDPNWPTPETGELWRQYRQGMLSAPVQKWSDETWPFDAKRPAWLEPGLPVRLMVDPVSRAASVVSPDFQPITTIVQRFDAVNPSLAHIDFAPDGQSASIKRIGRGKAQWRQP